MHLKELGRSKRAFSTSMHGVGRDEDFSSAVCGAQADGIEFVGDDEEGVGGGADSDEDYDELDAIEFGEDGEEEGEVDSGGGAGGGEEGEDAGGGEGEEGEGEDEGTGGTDAGEEEEAVGGVDDGEGAAGEKKKGKGWLW